MKANKENIFQNFRSEVEADCIDTLTRILNYFQLSSSANQSIFNYYNDCTQFDTKKDIFARAFLFRPFLKTINFWSKM